MPSKAAPIIRHLDISSKIGLEHARGPIAVSLALSASELAALRVNTQNDARLQINTDILTGEVTVKGDAALVSAALRDVQLAIQPQHHKTFHINIQTSQHGETEHSKAVVYFEQASGHHVVMMARGGGSPASLEEDVTTLDNKLALDDLSLHFEGGNLKKTASAFAFSDGEPTHPPAIYSLPPVYLRPNYIPPVQPLTSTPMPSPVSPEVTTPTPTPSSLPTPPVTTTPSVTTPSVITPPVVGGGGGGSTGPVARLFILTPTIDDFRGDSLEDTFQGAAADWAAADTLYGGGGVDGLTITSGVVNVNTTAYTNIQEIETWQFSANGAHQAIVGDSYFTRGVGLSAATISAVTYPASTLFISTPSTTGVRFDGSGIATATNNVFLTAASGADTLLGGAGNDSFDSGSGADSIVAGAGDDTLRFLAADLTAADTVQGGAGLDTIILSGSAATIVTAALPQLRGVENIQLNGDFAHSITFSNTYYFSAGFIGNTVTVTTDAATQGMLVDGSTLTTGGGQRMLSVTGGGGADSEYGGASADTISGGAGDDSIIGGAGSDVLFGDAGNDTIVPSGIVGSNGGNNDTITTGAGSDIIQFNYDFDAPSFNGGTLITDFTQGQDRVFFNQVPFDGIVAGAASGTTLGYTYDALNNWTVVRGGGIYGAGGTDFLLKLTGNIALTAADFIFTNISGAGVINGTAGHDGIIGSAGSDTIYGNGGPDEIFSGLGDDSVVTGSGPAFILELGGNDTIDGSAATTLFLRYFGGGSSLVNVSGNAQIYLNPGTNETVNGSAGADTISTFSFSGHSTIYGGNGGDVIASNTNAGHALLFGEAGNDSLSGGATGADTLNGGVGADNFQFVNTTASGIGVGNRDVIADFSQAQTDKIDLSVLAGIAIFQAGGAGAADLTGFVFQASYQQIGGNTIVMVDSNGDNAADFEIELTGLYVLVNGDFVL